MTAQAVAGAALPNALPDASTFDLVAARRVADDLSASHAAAPPSAPEQFLRNVQALATQPAQRAEWER